MNISIIYINLSVLKSRRVRWVGHAVRVGEKRNAYRGFFKGNWKEGDHLEEVG
jgi:hypothetical protein